MLLKNKIAFISGSSRGIGAATAKLFAQNGASVIVNYVNNEKAAMEVVKEIEAAGGVAIAVQADMTDFDQVKDMMDNISSSLGEIDILVLNAGMKFKIAPFLEQEIEDFEKKIMGEVKAVYYAVKLLAKSMIAKQNGCILIVSSGLSKNPGPGFVTHSAAKAALNMISHSLATELGPAGIRVNVIAPGLTLTDATSWMPEERKKAAAAINPTRRIGQPEDIAGALLIMASDYAGYINCGYLPVDGGMTKL